MTVTFVANFMNHHQLQFSLNMQRLTNGGYTFVAHMPVYQDRKDFGAPDMNTLPFVIRTYDSEEGYNQAMKKIENDDMVIFGGCPDEWIERRKKTGKPFLIYSERFFKKGTYRRFIPMTYKKIYNRMLKHEGDNMAVICSSAYLPYDLSLLHSKINTYKWGYFPEPKIYDDIDGLISKKKKNSILWAGRLLPWKHPEYIIYAARKLKRLGYSFDIDIVGKGPIEDKIKNSIKANGLSDCVHFLGVMTTEALREKMEESSIYIFTSDYYEGWGAVMNESMNSACAVVASHAAGSVPYLVKNGDSGLIYRYGNKKDFFEKVKFLLDNPNKCNELGLAAYKTIVDEWEPVNATERLYNIISGMVEGKESYVYEDGPCSVAEIIKPRYKG